MSAIKELKEAKKVLTVSNVLGEAFKNASGAVSAFTGELKSSKSIISAAQAGLKGLWGVIKAHPFIAAATAIVAFISIINKLSTASIDASEKSKEAAQKAMEVTANLDEEKDRVNELIEEYKELKDTEYVDEDTRKKIRDIQKEINSLVESETRGLDLVNGELDDQLLKLKQIQLEEAKRNQSGYVSGYYAARKSSDDAYVRDVEDYNWWAKWAANWAQIDLGIEGWDKEAADIINSVSGVSAIWDSNALTTLTAIRFDADSAEE